MDIRWNCNGFADDTAEYQPPSIHVGSDGCWMSTYLITDGNQTVGSISICAGDYKPIVKVMQKALDEL